MKSKKNLEYSFRNPQRFDNMNIQDKALFVKQYLADRDKIKKPVFYNGQLMTWIAPGN